MDLTPGAKALAEYGITIVACVVLALTVAWFLRDLVRQRDEWRSIAESAVSAFDRLIDQLDVQPVVRPEQRRRRQDEDK